ncbi:RNA pseudourine synthase, putative [Medicago truncatula]|uniref:RNA pseudourine synthase, putative n=1 Tax=Medicago truncatula TaxID=3880 RepID=A0A072UEE0_MEDTR|nr:RNA pseudourine synthase, putative [Medicago truncatula]
MAAYEFSNNITRLDVPKDAPKLRQLPLLPTFPSHPLPRKNSTSAPRERDHVTAVNWIKYYFKGASDSVTKSHFREGLIIQAE